MAENKEVQEETVKNNVVEEVVNKEVEATVEEVKTTKESKVVEEVEVIEKEKAIKEVEAIEEVKVTEKVKATEEVEVVEEIKATEEVEVAEEVKATEEVEVAEEVKATEEVEVAEEVKATEEVEVAEEVKATEEVEVAEEVKATEEVEVVEEIKATEEAEVIEEVKATEEVEVIEEVKATEEVIENIPSMDEFAVELDASMKRVSPGDIVECTIISMDEDEVVVNLGYVADGLIKKEELHVNSGQVLSEAYAIEDVLKAEVMTINDGEGNVLLSVKKADQIIVWNELESQFKEKTSFDVTISAAVKGGLIANIRGVRAFMPASRISVSYVEDLKEYIGVELKVQVVDFDRADGKVIISHKEIDKEEKAVAREALMSSLEKDQVFDGVVKKLMNFGAFVDIGGVDGLVHINEMSWKRIKHPSEVVKEGEVVEVYIKEIDRAKNRISLGLKNIGGNPWDNIFEYFTIGKVYEGEVMRLMNFGAFVKISDGIEGLVHISEISQDHINQPGDVLSVGDKVNVKVLTIDKDGHKIGLSIKESKEEEVAVEMAEYATEEQATTSLKSVFKNILKDIDLGN